MARPPHTIAVLVLDHEGSACAGVPIGIAAIDREERTGPDGVAEFAWDARRRAEMPGSWHARAHLAGVTDGAQVAFDPDTPPHPLVLRLPPTGQMRIAGRVLGRPAPLSQVLLLDLRDGLLREIEPAHDGEALVDLVPLGLRWQVSAAVAGRTHCIEVDGPTAPGEEILVALGPGDDAVVIAGRALDAVRQPLRNRDLRLAAVVDAPSGSREVRRTVRTDAAGRFAAELGADDAVRLREATLEHADDGPPEPAVHLAPRDLQRGENALGDVVLGTGEFAPVVLAGRLVDATGRAVDLPVELVVERFDAAAECWTRVWRLRTERDGASFALHGTVPPGRCRLRVDGPDLLPTAPLPFAIGATGIEVPVAVGHALAATILAPLDLPPGVVAIVHPECGLDAEPTGGPTILFEPGFALGSRFRQPVQGGGRCRVHWRGLPAGTCRLEVRFWSTGQSLVDIRDVHVGGVADPRLLAIDLRAAIATVRVRAVDAAGAPAEIPGLTVFVLPQPLDGTWRGQPAWPAGIAVPAGPLDLWIAAPGHRPSTLRGVSGDVAVALQPLPELELALREPPPLPPGWTLCAALAARPRDVRVETGVAHGDDAELLGATPAAMRPFENGRVRLPHGDDGPFRVELHLRHAAHGSRRLDVDTTFAIEPGSTPRSAPIEVRVPAAAVERALRELGTGAGRAGLPGGR